MKEMLKTLLILIAYFGVGPLLGFVIAKSRNAQRAVFCLMMAMPAFQPGDITMMLDSCALYRGHTKGFEANWIEVLGISLLLAGWLSRKRGSSWRLRVPGASLYLAWVALSMISIFSAPDKGYALMAGFKFVKVVILFVAAANFFRDEVDLNWMMRTIAGVQIFYLLLCLKLRYVDHLFQIKGWFEHQNPMAMWCYMSAIPLLGVSLNLHTSRKDFVLYLAGFCAASACIILSVSRAGLGALSAGSLAVLAVACLRDPNRRVLLVTIGGVVLAGLVSAFAMKSFHARLNEVAESAQKSQSDLREILNLQSYAMLKDSAIGVGWNNFGVMNSRPDGEKYSAILEAWDESRGFRVYDENYHANPLTESLYWLMLAETGYPGFVAFLVFAVATLWFAAAATWRFRHSVMGAYAVSVLITLGICYSHGTVERILTQTKNLSYWMMVCGVLSALYAAPKPVLVKQIARPRLKMPRAALLKA